MNRPVFKLQKDMPLFALYESEECIFHLNFSVRRCSLFPFNAAHWQLLMVF